MENILPSDFDGVFRFTNFSDRDFTAKWDNVSYTFPALKTSPMIMPFTPVEIQSIRKKFARELAEREFYLTEKFKSMNNIVPGGTPALYTDSDLTQFVQKCLEPLEVASVITKVLPKGNEDFMSKDRKGKNVSRVLDADESLIKETGSEVVG